MYCWPFDRLIVKSFEQDPETLSELFEFEFVYLLTHYGYKYKYTYNTFLKSQVQRHNLKRQQSAYNDMSELLYRHYIYNGNVLTVF